MRVDTKREIRTTRSADNFVYAQERGKSFVGLRLCGRSYLGFR